MEGRRWRRGRGEERSLMVACFLDTLIDFIGGIVEDEGGLTHFDLFHTVEAISHLPLPGYIDPWDLQQDIISTIRWESIFGETLSIGMLLSALAISLTVPIPLTTVP